MHDTYEGETHSICRDRLELFGGNGECCFCKPHENCLLMAQINEQKPNIEETEKTSG